MSIVGDDACLQDKGRDHKGKWVAGVSGNPGGRPKKKPAVPKSLADQLAEAMAEEIPVIDAQGRREMVPAYQVATRQLVRSIPEMKPKELMTTIRWMQDLQVYEAMLKQAGSTPDTFDVEQARERVKAHLAELIRRQQMGTLG